jgi:DNA-binding XRE family transcriptional regulator
MPKRKSNKLTVGQQLWFSLYQAEGYQQEAERTAVPAGAPRHDVQRATRAWLQGMSRHMKTQFSIGLRLGREKAGVTQQQIAEIAEFTPNAVAMIERGERVPNLETAARLCWALDIASGVSPVAISV